MALCQSTNEQTLLCSFPFEMCERGTVKANDGHLRLVTRVDTTLYERQRRHKTAGISYIAFEQASENVLLVAKHNQV